MVLGFGVQIARQHGFRVYLIMLKFSSVALIS